MLCSKRISQALGIHELYRKRFYRDLFSEFLGVTWLLLITSSLGTKFEGKQHDVVRNSLCASLAVSTIVWSLANASSHINPAISTAFCVTGHISPVRAFCYVISQCSGSCFGTYLGSLTQSPQFIHYSVNVPHPSITYGQAVGMEAFCTAVLAITVFSTVDKTRHDHHGSGPLAIGFAVGLSHLLGEEFTGASMNPARSFGPAIISGQMNNLSIYVLGPLLGSISTAIFYHFIIAGDASPRKFVDEAKDLCRDFLAPEESIDEISENMKMNIANGEIAPALANQSAAMSRRRSRKPSLMIHFEDNSQAEEENYILHPAITLCPPRELRRASANLISTSDRSRALSISKGIREVDIAENVEGEEESND